MTIVWPGPETKLITDAIRGAVGRLVTVVVPAVTAACTVCSLDPVTGLSTDSFCPVCSGSYWITAYSNYTMSGHITWYPMDSLDWRTGGQIFNGDVRVQVAYTPENLAAIAIAEYYIVDGIYCDFKEQAYRGFPLNRVILSLIENKEHTPLPTVLPVLPVIAHDSGSNHLNAVYSGVVLGGSVNRAYFDGLDQSTKVDIYSPELDALYNGKEVTIIVRGAVRHASTWTDGVNHNLISIYTWPFGNDATIDISAGGLLEWTMMTGGFPGIILRQVATSDLGWMTLGMTISQSASEMRAYKEGVQQGAALGAGMDWSRPLWIYGCMIGSPRWKGWGGDCIISFGVVATPAQMLTIHTKLDTVTLTTADLDAIFGVGKYAWWPLDES